MCISRRKQKGGLCFLSFQANDTHTAISPRKMLVSRARLRQHFPISFFCEERKPVPQVCSQQDFKIPVTELFFSPLLPPRKKKERKKKSYCRKHICSPLSSNNLQKRRGESIREFASPNFQLSPPPPPPPPHLPHPAVVLFHFLFSLLRIGCSRKKNYCTTLSQEQEVKNMLQMFFGSLTLLLQRRENKECMFEQGRLLMFRMP